MYRFLTYCARDYGSESELDQAIEQVYQTHTVPIPESGRDSHVEADDYGDVENQMRKRFELCANISEASTKEAGHWLELAADNSYPRAMTQYANRHPGESRSLQYLEAAWLAGDSSAPADLAHYYREATDTFPHTQKPDKIAAYAYTYLGMKLWDMKWDTTLVDMKLSAVGDIARRWEAANEEHLRLETLKLAAHELEAGTEMAKTILRNNENCCYVIRQWTLGHF